MVRITAVMGSPRKGDSYRVVRKIEERIAKIGDIDFQYVFLKDHNIQMCKGCFQCVRTGEQTCPIQDDAPKIMEMLKQSDGIIFASPVYALGITGLMKNFQDRTAYNAHRPTFWSKKAMAVVTSEGTGMQSALAQIQWWAIWGMEFSAELAVNIHPTLQPSPRYEAEIERSIAKATETFYRSLQHRQEKKPKPMKVIQFHILKYMASAAPDGFPADCDYYRSKAAYYYKADVNAFNTLIARIFTGFAAKWMKRNYIMSC